jgi:hypothetical protein
VTRSLYAASTEHFDSNNNAVHVLVLDVGFGRYKGAVKYLIRAPAAKARTAVLLLSILLSSVLQPVGKNILNYLRGKATCRLHTDAAILIKPLFTHIRQGAPSCF